MESSLQQSVNACVEELAEIRKELRHVNGRVGALDDLLAKVAREVQSSSSSSARPSTACGNRGSLSEICMIEDPLLKDIFLAACFSGQLRLELSTLLSRASADNRYQEGSLSNALVKEIQQGSLRATIFNAKQPLQGSGSPLYEVSAAVCSRTCADWVCKQIHAVELRSENDCEVQRIIFSPVFREACWPLLEVAMRWCRKDAVPSRLDILHRTVRSLLHDRGSFRETDLFTLASSAPDALRLSPGGELVADCGNQASTFVDNLPQASLDAARPFLQQAVAGLWACSGSPGEARTSDAVLLELLVLLRDRLFSKVLCFPGSNLNLANLSGRALLKLLEPPDVEDVSTPMACHRDSPFADDVIVLQPACPVGAVIQEQPLVSMNQPDRVASDIVGAGSIEQGKIEMGSSDEEYEGDAGVQAQVQILQAAFLKCFSDELSNQRPLLLSQLNNLYKMRSGEELNYKIAGYEKLRDFLMEFPGLSLIGRGNRMQVKVVDEQAFAVFQEGLQQNRGHLEQTPEFQMPEPLPESLQLKIYELFAGAENYEIPLRSFLNAWNSRYPMEQLAYRNLGFRDVRGVLSNVPFIEKVGGKSDAKYVLRQSEIAKMGAVGKIGDIPMLIRPTKTDGPQGVGNASHDSQPLLRPPGMFGPNPSSREPVSVRSSGLGIDRRLLDSRQPMDEIDDSRRLQLGSWARGGPAAGAEFVQPSFAMPLSPGGSSSGLGLTAATLGMGLTQPAGRSRKSLGLQVPLTVEEERLEASPRTEGEYAPALPVLNSDASLIPPAAAGGLLAAQGSRKVRGAKKKQASFFVSSPGAFSSDTRDMGIHQGKFDMCSVLQTQLKQGSPSLVCDISGGSVMVTNNECEDLFETHDTESRLVQSDVYSLIHDEDRDQFSTNFAYLLVSEKTKMEPQQLRVVTLLGNTRHVQCEGVQLIGIWWQLNFIRSDINGF